MEKEKYFVQMYIQKDVDIFEDAFCDYGNGQECTEYLLCEQCCCCEHHCTCNEEEQEEE